MVFHDAVARAGIRTRDFFSGHFYVHRRCAIWSDKVRVKTIKHEDAAETKKAKDTETYVGVDQVRI